jgi:hypothetical protein
MLYINNNEFDDNDYYVDAILTNIKINVKQNKIKKPRPLPSVSATKYNVGIKKKEMMEKTNINF